MNCQLSRSEMPRWKLVPVSSLASELTQDVYLNSSLRIGRNVAGPDAVTLPPTLTQFSGMHCRVYADLSSGNVQWFIEDTSTNGTFVDGERIVRNTSVRLLEGSRLRLSSPPQDVLEFEFIRDYAEDERGDNYSHYSRPQHGLPQHHHVSQYAGGHYPAPYTSAAPACTAGGNVAALQGHLKSQPSHVAFGMSGGGTGGAGSGGGNGAAAAVGCGEGTNAPPNPTPGNNNKRKMNELGGCSGDVTMHPGAASAVAPNRNVARRLVNNTPASGAGGGGGGVSMSYGIPPMGMGAGGTATAAMAATRPSSAAVSSFYGGNGGLAAPLGGGNGGAGTAAEALVHMQAQLRAEKSEKEGLKRQLEALRRECDDAARNLEALREQHTRQLDRSANERQMSSSREESLRSMLAAAEARAELVSRQAETAAERARGELAEAETARRHAEREAADTKAQLAAGRDELGRLSSELRAERSDAAAQRAAAAAARRETESIREALVAEQRDKKAEQDRAERLQQQVEVEKASAAAARRMAEQHEAEVRAARTQAEDEQRSRREVGEKALSLQGQVEEARRRLAEAHERISGLQDELAARHHRLCALSESHTQSDQLLNGLQQTVAALTHMHSSLSHQYAQALAVSNGMSPTAECDTGVGNGAGAGTGGGCDGPAGQGHGAVGGGQQQALGAQTEVACAEEQIGMYGLGLGDNPEGLRATMQQSQLGASGGMHPPSTLPGYAFPGTGTAPAGHRPGANHPHGGGGAGIMYGSADPNGLGHGAANLMATPPTGVHCPGAAQNLTQQLHLMSQHLQHHLNHATAAQQQQQYQQQQASFMMMSQQQQQAQQQHYGQGTQQEQQPYGGMGSMQGATGRGGNGGGGGAVTLGSLFSQQLPHVGVVTPQLLQCIDGATAGRGGTQPGSTALTPPQQQPQLPASQQLQLLPPPLLPVGLAIDGTQGAAGATGGPLPPGARVGSQLPVGSLPQPFQHLQPQMMSQKQQQQQQLVKSGVICDEFDGVGSGAGGDVGGGGGGGAPSDASASQQTTPAAVARATGGRDRQVNTLGGGPGDVHLDDTGGGGVTEEEEEEEGDGSTSHIRNGVSGGGGQPGCMSPRGADAMELDIATAGGADVSPPCAHTLKGAAQMLYSGPPRLQSPKEQQPLLHITPTVVAALPPDITMEEVAAGDIPRGNASRQQQPAATEATSNETTAAPEATSCGGGGAAATGGSGSARVIVAAAWPRLFSRHLTPSKNLNGAMEAAAAAADGDPAAAAGDVATPASRPCRSPTSDGDATAVLGVPGAVVRSHAGNNHGGAAGTSAAALTRAAVAAAMAMSNASQDGREDRWRNRNGSIGDGGGDAADGTEPRTQEPSPHGGGAALGGSAATGGVLLQEWQQYGRMPHDLDGGGVGGGKLRGTAIQ